MGPRCQIPPHLRRVPYPQTRPLLPQREGAPSHLEIRFQESRHSDLSRNNAVLRISRLQSPESYPLAARCWQELPQEGSTERRLTRTQIESRRCSRLRLAPFQTYTHLCSLVSLTKPFFLRSIVVFPISLQCYLLLSLPPSLSKHRWGFG